ncbi:MAG: hypothetical protein HPY83_15895 [Anaerolineae bacterium]|nr:hypothetical protein [Anaerolineae bacterium]
MTRQEVCDRLQEAIEPVSPLPRGRLGQLVRRAWGRAITRDFPVLLPVWAAEAVGGASRLTLDVAAAWCGLYLAAKLLDDLQDGDPSILGSAVSTPSILNTATSLVFAAQGCLAGSGADGQSSTRVSLAAEFYRYSLEVAAGQELGMQPPPEGEKVLPWAWEVLQKKGARPFALACRAGAISGGASAEAVEVLTELGQCIGETVQLMDDALGLRARDVGDIRSVALPLAYGLSVGNEEEVQSLTSLAAAAGNGDSEAAESLCLLLEGMGAMRYLSIRASAGALRARSLLSSSVLLSSSPGVRALAGVLDRLDPAGGDTLCA